MTRASPLILFVSLCLSTGALGADICTARSPTAPAASVPQARVPSALERFRSLLHRAADLPQAVEEKRFSYYAYRHGEAHARGLVSRLIRRTGQNCCDDGKGGECRIATVDMVKKRAFVNGMWCPLSKTTSVVVLPDLQAMQKGETHDIALVCANRAKGPDCYAIYCVGLKGMSG